MNKVKFNTLSDQPPVLSAEANEKVVDTNINTKPSRLGFWSLGVSIVCPTLILFSFFTFADHANANSIIGYSFYGIIIYPIISITLSIVALASGEEKSPAILGLIFSIIGGVGLILLYVVMYAFTGLNSVW